MSGRGVRGATGSGAAGFSLVMDDMTTRLADDLDGTFPEVVRAFQDDLFSGMRRLAPDRMEAEDLTQETFIRAYRALDGYDRGRIRELQLRGWLWTIALNLSRNRARDRGRRPIPVPLEDGRHRGEPDPEPFDAATWDRRLATLPIAQRRAVVLRHVVGLSYEEIAGATGRAVGTAKTDVHRGLARLRTILEEEST